MTSLKDKHKRRLRLTLGSIMITIAAFAIIFAVVRPLATPVPEVAEVIGIDFALETTREPDGHVGFGFAPRITTARKVTASQKVIVMNRYAALIRGINVGRAKRVAMADLRALVAESGYTSVSTLLNSGNVVFTGNCPDQTQAGLLLEKAIATKTGVNARVTVLSAAEISAAMQNNPLLDVADDPTRLLVTIFNTPADRSKIEPLTEQDWAPDRLALGTRVAYVWCAEGILVSRLGTAVSKALGDAGTSRNWATMIKLKALVDSSQ